MIVVVLGWLNTPVDITTLFYQLSSLNVVVNDCSRLRVVKYTLT